MPAEPARIEDTRRAIEAMRRLRRVSPLPVDAATVDYHQAPPSGHKAPFVQRDLSVLSLAAGLVYFHLLLDSLSQAGLVVSAQGSDRYSDP